MAICAKEALTLADKPDRVSIEVYLDFDEPKTDEYLAIAKQIKNINITIGERISVPEADNALAAKSDADVMYLIGDDNVCRTQGWDTKTEELFAQYPDRLLVAYLNDGRDRDKVEAMAVSREWVRALGYALPPMFEHFSADEYVGDVAERAGRLVWLNGVTFEHMHPKYGKGEWDETYKRTRINNMSARDAARYALSEKQREADAHKILARLCR